MQKEDNNFATIADNLPASATEIDPMVNVKPEEDVNMTLQAKPEDGKI